MKFTLSNNWTVEKQDGKHAILHVTPIPNSLFRKEQFIDLPANVMDAIESGVTDVKTLFKEYDLHKLIIQWTSAPSSNVERVNTATKYHGPDFIATKENDTYFISYLLARQGGGERKIRVSEDLFNDAKTGKYACSDLFEKHNLYHLDIPENDID